MTDHLIVTLDSTGHNAGLEQVADMVRISWVMQANHLIIMYTLDSTCYHARLVQGDIQVDMA